MPVTATSPFACPTCLGELEERPDALLCRECGASFALANDVPDLIAAGVRIASEGPGDTPAMAWRRQRFDVLRGPEAPENALLLERLLEVIDDGALVVDLGCGPGTLLGWLADRRPGAQYIGLDIATAALDLARRDAGRRAIYGRASTRRQYPFASATVDVVVRRLAPALLDEVARVLRPGGRYVRFTFGPRHWAEVYDRVPGLPRAREETLATEAAHLARLGLAIEPVHTIEREIPFSRPAVLLALRANPAAFHINRVDLEPLHRLWRDEEGGRREHVPLTVEAQVLVARRPVADASQPPA